MDVSLLARAQFGLTVMFHFLFPSLLMGLALLIVIFETFRWRTGDDLYRRASDFWLRLLGITFLAGTASAIVLELRFGMNWTAWSRLVAGVLGAPVAVGSLFAFLIEAGFLGLLLFRGDRLSSGARWLAAVLVWLGSTRATVGLLLTSSWMQTPAGYRLASGRPELTDSWAAAFNPSALHRVGHTVTSAWACAAFLMTGIAAWYFLRLRRSDVARLSLKAGVIAAFVSSLLVFGTGDRHARQVAHTQPAKFAAMQGLYSTGTGVPLVLFSLPPRQDEKSRGPEITVTRLTSFLAFGNFQAPVKGLEEFPRPDWPPVAATFLSFHNMVILGNVMLLEALFGLILLWRGKLETSRRWLWLLVLSIPLPHLAVQLGWLAAEVGRQPWLVYGVLRGGESPAAAADGCPAIAVASVVQLALAALWILWLRREIVRGPEALDVRPGGPLAPRTGEI